MESARISKLEELARSPDIRRIMRTTPPLPILAADLHRRTINYCVDRQMLRGFLFAMKMHVPKKNKDGSISKRNASKRKIAAAGARNLRSQMRKEFLVG